jgi:tetratricopeptide (TPR) repeat protein
VLASAKSVYADGDVIFREGNLCESAFEVLSGNVDLLKQKDGKYARQGNIETGETFGKPGIPYDVTLRAKGRTVLRNVERLLEEPEQSEPEKTGVVGSLMRRLGGSNDQPGTPDNTYGGASGGDTAYSNPGMIRRLLDGLSSDNERIGVRVAVLTGADGKQNTRHVMSALGNTKSLQTKGFNSPISLDPTGDIPKQLNRIASAARKWLLLQGADILVWGHIPATGQVMHLRFITLANWDQQAPGAFDLETDLALPVNFGPELADLLRAVTLAAALPRTNGKKRLRQQALLESLASGAAALDVIPPDMTNRERASIHMCFANALSAASRPGYNSEFLSRAEERYRIVLSILPEDNAPFDRAQAQKHLGSILHIEAERNRDPNQLEQAILALRDANSLLNADRYPRPWAIVQNRLGLICYRQGFEDGDTKLLRQALKCFKGALGIYTKDNAPLRWAEIMSNFAQAAQVLGGLVQSMEALATAANACKAVLEVRDRRKMPMSWAATQNNLGSALFLLGKQSRSPDRLRAAIAAFEQALIIYRGTNSQNLAAVTEKNLDRSQEMLDFCEPKNMPELDWEDVLFEDDIIEKPRLPEPGEGLFTKPDAPWPGERPSSNKTRPDQDWFLEAV